MTKFCYAFLLATVFADKADDLLALMKAKEDAFKGLLAGPKEEIKADAIKAIFVADGSEDLKTAAAIEKGDDGAIDFEKMVEILGLVKEDAEANVTEANVDLLIDTVQSEDPEKETVNAAMVTLLKSIAPAADAATDPVVDPPTEPTTDDTKTDTETDTETDPVVEGGDDASSSTTVAADEAEEEEEDEKSASFNFALSSALLSIVV